LAVKLRLTRLGRKKRPFYRIIAVDSRAPRDGRYLENLGTYDPLPEPFEFKVNEDRIFYWLGVGAIPSDTVKSLLRREGILFKWDLKKRGLSDEQMEQEMKRWEVIQLERRRKSEKKLEEKAKVKEKEEKEEKERIEEQDDQKAEQVVEEVPEVVEAAEAVVEEETPDQPDQSPEPDSDSEETKTKE
jgi:small subunit ribosomal protein S16